MAVHFSGFPRALTPRALRPGRWFVPAGPVTQLCLMTGIGEGPAAATLCFSLGRLDALDFRPRPLSTLSEPFQSVEDDIVFSPGDGAAVQLFPAHHGPYASGSLLRLSNGDIGIGFAERLHARVVTLSLTTGLPAEGVDLVFERWALMMRRGGVETLLGRFRPDVQGWRPTEAQGVQS